MQIPLWLLVVFLVLGAALFTLATDPGVLARLLNWLHPPRKKKPGENESPKEEPGQGVE